MKMIEWIRAFSFKVGTELKHLTYPKRGKVTRDTGYVLITAMMISMIIALEIAGVSTGAMKVSSAMP